jgi:GT2 family glycosyltransferase
MSRVTAVVPSWNGAHLLPFCLAALDRQDEAGLNVLVVDNGSSDGTAEALARSPRPAVSVLRLSLNHGFSGAVNAGIEAARTPYVLVLNNDAAPERGYVSALASFLDAHPGAAAVQGRILRHADPSVIDSLGIRIDRRLRAHQIGWRERDPGPSGPPRRVDGVSACAALYRVAALMDAADPGQPPAVFDPDFFAYYEDVDLALRLARRGWESFVLPAVSCEHVGSATGGEGSWRKMRLLGRNHLLYVARHEGGWSFLGRAPALVARSLARAATFPLHPRRETALWAGELAALPGLPGAFLKGRRDRRRAARAPTTPWPA